MISMMTCVQFSGELVAEEQQLHLSVGLQKIRETVEQVEELQASLSIKENELEQRNTLVKADGS